MPENYPGLLDFAKTYKPFYYEWAMEATVAHELVHWGEHEVVLQPDVEQWKTGVIKPEEKNNVTRILQIFTQSDVQVATNYYDLYIPRFRNNEVRNMLGSFACREGVHQRAYALLNDTLGLPDSEYQAFLNIPQMMAKIEFMQNNDVSTQTGLGLALAQTCINEGVGLFSAFTMLLNYQRYGKLRGTCEVVEWSINFSSAH